MRCLHRNFSIKILGVIGRDLQSKEFREHFLISLAEQCRIFSSQQVLFPPFVAAKSSISRMFIRMKTLIKNIKIYRVCKCKLFQYHFLTFFKRIPIFCFRAQRDVIFIHPLLNFCFLSQHLIMVDFTIPRILVQDPDRCFRVSDKRLGKKRGVNKIVRLVTFPVIGRNDICISFQDKFSRLPCIQDISPVFDFRLVPRTARQNFLQFCLHRCLHLFFALLKLRKQTT